MWLRGCTSKGDNTLTLVVVVQVVVVGDVVVVQQVAVVPRGALPPTQGQEAQVSDSFWRSISGN